MTIAQLQRAALALPAEERHRLVEVLLESLAREPIELPTWQQEFLDQRLAALENHPQRGSPWEEVEKRVFLEDE